MIWIWMILTNSVVIFKGIPSVEYKKLIPQSLAKWIWWKGLGVEGVCKLDVISFHLEEIRDAAQSHLGSH